MTTTALPVKNQPPIMLKNVSALLLLADKLLYRPVGVPGFGCFSGYPGLGKSMACQKVQNMRQAIYLEARDWWTRKVFLEMVLAELGDMKPPRTIADMMRRIISILGDDPGQLLILDEADKLVDKGMIELVRSLQADTQIPIVLVGEELLPQKLRSSERMFDRVLEWGLAQPCDVADARLLATRYCAGIEIADELLEEVARKAGGNARKIVVTLDKARNFAVNSGLSVLSLDTYDGGFHTGEPLTRRK